MTEPLKLTPSLQRMLQWISDVGDRGVMLLQITANGRSEYNKAQKLLNAGYLKWGDVKLAREEVDGVFITEAGRAALAAKKGPPA